MAEWSSSARSRPGRQPALGAYSASKFALAALADSLRAELKPSDIKVILVEPGTIATEIWSTAVSAGRALYDRLPVEARRYYGAAMEATINTAEERGGNGLAPEAAARVLVRALERPNPRPRYLIGRDARFASVIPYLPATLRAYLVATQMPAGPAKDTPSPAITDR
nr:SDR family NAD(P)-dependent oxidoreductase [Fodinicola feengrottensis]